MRVDKAHEFTYYSGHDSPEVAEAAARRGDIGLVITPGTAYLLERAAPYQRIVIDNGAFQARGFNAGAFERLLDRVQANPVARSKVQFVVAPDVVCNALATLRQFGEWADRIRARGFAVALAGQDGLEQIQQRVPWREFDVFFVGGSTQWKLGASGSPLWDRMLARASETGRIHFGRVNSSKRMDFSDWMGATSADGTFTMYSPAVNVKRLERFLDNVNTVTWGTATSKPWQGCLSFE